MVNDLILLIFQLFILPLPAPHALEITTLIRLCEALNINAGAVRTAVSRLKKQGFFSAKKTGLSSRYTITPKAIMAREFYNKKIFIGEDVYYNWKREWWLLSFAFEQAQEKQRGQLRSLLKKMDFGCLHRGVWLKPVDPYLWLDQALENQGFNKHVHIFTTKITHIEKAQQLAQHLWELGKIAQQFAEYQELLRAKIADYPHWDDQACFIRHIKLFKEFADPLINNPLLPPQLFPKDWPGTTYRELFKRVNDRLALKSQRFVKSVIEAG